MHDTMPSVDRRASEANDHRAFKPGKDTIVMLPVRVARLALTVVVSASLLGGCAQGALSTQSSRIGSDDGSDSCRRNLVALDSMGDYFGADILKGAAIGAAAGGLSGALFGGNLKGALIGAGAGALLGGTVGYWSALQQQSQDQAVLSAQVRGDIERENSQIDRTQAAFDALMDCRFRQAQLIQSDYLAHRIDRPTAVAQMARVKQMAENDLQVARRINGEIASRGGQFEVAADNLQPVAGTSAATAKPGAPATRTVVVRRAAPLKLHPDPTAPDVGMLQPRDTVQVGSTRSGFAVVQTKTGTRGYAAVDTFQGAAPPTTQPASGDIRTLAGSNASRRDDFAQSVAVTEHAVSSGFELVG
jgi:hypothetical protein